MRSIMLLPLVARFLKTIDECIWHMFVFYVCCNNCGGSVGMFVVYRSLLKILGVMDVVFYICIATRGAVGTRIWEL